MRQTYLRKAFDAHKEEIRATFLEKWTGPPAEAVKAKLSGLHRDGWRRLKHDGQLASACPFDGLAVITLPPMDYRTGGLGLEPAGYRILCLPPWTHHTTASTADGA